MLRYTYIVCLNTADMKIRLLCEVTTCLWVFTDILKDCVPLSSVSSNPRSVLILELVCS